ncbi:MAG TPA: peptidase domain-containing ABC transporter [Polyangiaceae bacterium]|nr:peptidase domain-containing ABC transporter [Polyangiaceae bacterium]
MGRRVIPVEQMEVAECGIACLAMVLGYHGAFLRLDELRRVCGTSRDGNSALDLVNAAQSLGLDAIGKKAPVDYLREAQLPCILHWQMNHFVVLEGFRKNRAKIVDPALGRREVGPEELHSSFTGVLLEFSRTEQLRRRKRPALGYGRYVKAVLSRPNAVVFVLSIAVARQILAVVYPTLTRVLVDEVIRPQRQRWLLPVLGVLVVTTVLQLILLRYQSRCLARLHATLGAELSGKLGEHLFRLPLEVLMSRQHGDLLERVQQHGLLKSQMTDALTGFLKLMFLVSLAGLMLVYSPGLAAVVLAVSALRVAILLAVRRPLRQLATEELSAAGRERGCLLEATAGAELLRGFRAEERVQARYTKRLAKRINCSIRAQRFRSGSEHWLSTFGGLTLAGALAFGGQLVTTGQMTPGVFAAFVAMLNLWEEPLGAVVSSVENWIRCRSILERCDDILSTPRVESPESGPTAVHGHLVLRDVGYRYGTRGPWLFRNVTLELRPGEHCAIVGPSGHGKSTLAKLLCGLLLPTEGQVFIDGVEPQRFPSDVLARDFGVVLQGPVIVDGTLGENVSVRVPGLDQSGIHDALRTCCLEHVVGQLTRGVHTPLRAEQPIFSGGEMQRLALAQAVAGRPRMLLLDEATSSLDADTEAHVMANLRELDATIVSVAHRPGAVRGADRLLVVAGGAVQEFDRSYAGMDLSFEQVGA